MAGKNKKQVDTLLVAAFAKGATVTQAALQAGVSERTVFRRLQTTDLQRRIDEFHDDLRQRTADVLTAANPQAVHSLVALLDASTPPQVRRSAARDILEMGQRLRSDVEIEKRLLALEQDHLASSSSRPGGATVPSSPPTPSLATGKRRRRGDASLQTALACGSTVAQAAGKANVTERTVYRRLQDPAFRQRIVALRFEMLQRAIALLIAASLLAAKTLIDLQDANTPAATRRRAARDILELSEQLRQGIVLEKRLAALEAEQAKSDQRQSNAEAMPRIYFGT